MTPQEVHSLVEGILNARLYPQWYIWALSLLGAALAGGLIAWFGSYFKVKAQNFANKEDVQALAEQIRATTRATEEIKAEIGGQLWEVQTRWAIKRDLYFRLLEALGDAAYAMRQLSFLDAIYNDPVQAAKKQEVEQGLNEYLDDLQKHQTRLRAAQAVAPVVLPKDALATLDDLLRAWVAAQRDFNAKSLEELRAVTIRTMTGLTEVAQRDLLIRPREGPRPN